MRLGVNVDHVATLRQARRTVAYPDPVAAAVLAELAGADLITVHLREDRRHIQDRDVEILKRTVTTELNLEMACVDAIVERAIAIHPDIATLVPERRQEITTEGGLDAVGGGAALARTVGRLGEAGIVVSLFIDPDPEQVRASREAGADRVEIHTGRYADAKVRSDRLVELERIASAARAAEALGLGVAAGHGLNYQNVGPVAGIAPLDELNIGHAIVARAVLVGFERAVREMKALLPQ